ncbi:primosomal protein DnaI [Bacillus ndiopicus]|uniref:primosomal protein DnaI n=1 Tax=Bacillus ndiopicus TaxID=1347368 RepID=UPI0005A8B6F9|nr:primosomal protein DnaI [Bacillus ndiopicus]
MEPIKDSLKRVVNVPSFQERYEAMRQTILQHEQVQQFIEQNAGEIDNQTIERSLLKLHEYISQSTVCCKCGTTAQCTNYLQGFIPKLLITNGRIDITYERCEQKILEDERKEIASMVSSMHMPKEVLQATFEDIAIDGNRSRLDIVQQIVQFIDMYRTTGELPHRGLYLYGQFGVGKSFILGAIANELAKLKVKSVLVYVPEFLRELKAAIADHTLESKVDFVKRAPVLMLDDIGAEAISQWARDEILGTILHYRMSEQLPTFISSNFNYEELEHHLAHSQRGEIEEVKARRLMERIKATTSIMKVEGENLRR